MATKQYEYFGNQNPTMNGRMVPARMRAQNMANIAADQSNWARDPWFTLGSTIGQAWADRYNERGVEKGRGEMQSALDNYLKQNGGTQQANNIGVGTSEGFSADNGSANINGGVFAGLTAPMTPQDAYKEYKNQAWLSKYGDPNNPNPDSTAITVKNDSQAMDKMGDGIDFSRVNKEDARQAMRDQLRQNGRTPYQIDQVMANFDAMYDEKYGKWQSNKVTDLITKGENAAKEGRWDDAQNYYMAAGQYDPKRAGTYMQGLQQSYNRKMAEQQQRDKEYMAGYMRDENGKLVINPNHPVWQSRKYASSGSGTSTKNDSSKQKKDSTVDLEDGIHKKLDAYNKTYDSLKKSADAIDLEVEPERADEKKGLQDKAAKMLKAIGQEANKLDYFREGAPFHDEHWMGTLDEDGNFIPGSFANTDGGESDNGLYLQDQNQADADELAGNTAYIPKKPKTRGWISGDAVLGDVRSWDEINEENRKRQGKK